MSDETVHNEALSCMHFAFPSISEQLEEHTLFLYGHKEPACRLFFKDVVRAYPLARTNVIPGEPHCSFCSKGRMSIRNFLKESVKNLSDDRFFRCVHSSEVIILMNCSDAPAGMQAKGSRKKRDPSDTIGVWKK